ncbi:MAG: hypothetical protein ACYTHM_13375 [Planctomycetota bacterium]|jgi:hypothetical protein
MSGKMGLALAVAAGLMTGVLIPVALAEDAFPADTECTGDPKVIKQLRVEINALNLMNGLHLTVSQVETLLEGAKKNKELRATHLGEGEPGKPGEAEAKQQYETLLALKRILEKGENPDPGFLKALKSRHDKAGRRKKRAFKPDRAAYIRALKALEDGIEAILLESQKEVISTYKPCLIPPKNLKDPVRVGQASDHSRAGRMLARLRKLSDSQWGKMGEAILSKGLEAWEERHGKFSEEERKAELARAMTVVEEARKLSDIEFEMAKDDLAKRVEFTNRKDVLQKELKTLVKKNADPPGTVANTLLDPRIIPVLERRLKQMKEFEREEGVDLDKVKGTDAKKGKCGKKYDD